MIRSNSINIVLLERCGHPLTGAFPDDHPVDEPLDPGQVLMLRIAVDRLVEHISPEERALLGAMSAGRDHLVPTTLTAGRARDLAGIISHLWDRSPEAERDRLGEWFRCFNSSPGRRSGPPCRGTEGPSGPAI